MNDNLHEILIEIIQRWLEQDSDPPLCRLFSRSVSLQELIKLKNIKEQEQSIYENVCFQAGQRWQESLKLRACNGDLACVPFLAQIKIKYGLERLKKQIDTDILATSSNWCNQRGWTDLFIFEGRFWAFPPYAVLPLPIFQA